MTPGGARPTSALIGAFAAVVVLAGCGPDATSPPPPTPPPTPRPTATVTRYPLAVTVWYAGLRLTFHAATATIDRKGGPVQVDVTIENPGPDPANLNGPIRLAARGTLLEPTHDSEIPGIDGAASVDISLAFDTGPAFDVATASLVVGRETERRAIVPLSPAAGAPITLEPRTAALTGTARAGSLAIRLRSVELRADLPDWYAELPGDRMAISLTYDLTARTDFPGGIAFTADNVRLRLPDGTLVAPRADGRSQSILHVGPHATSTGLTSRFEIPRRAGGTYALVLVDGAATASVKFALP